MVQCGTVIVPESHAHPTNGRTIALPVAVYKALTPHPAPEPIVFLTGGPGQSGEAYARLLTDSFYHAYAAHNDLILFDERGTGASVSSLTCPPTPQTTDPVAALLACRDTLTRRGIDLGAYTDTENAADVNDIRAALGYARINLEGGSYGSELGLAVLRDYAPTVRSAVLESIVPRRRMRSAKGSSTTTARSRRSARSAPRTPSATRSTPMCAVACSARRTTWTRIP